MNFRSGGRADFGAAQPRRAARPGARLARVERVDAHAPGHALLRPAPDCRMVSITNFWPIYIHNIQLWTLSLALYLHTVVPTYYNSFSILDIF